MNRTLLVIFGITIIIALVGIWIYIVFGDSDPTPPKEDFADLNFPNTVNNDPVGTTTENPVINIENDDPLRQLTTTPVAGFQEVVTSTTSDPIFYYVELGSGHIFTIDLETGEETRISGTTMAGTKKAVITPDGQFVLLESGFGKDSQYDIAMIDSSTEQLNYQPFVENLTDFTFTLDSNFLYTTRENNQTIGKVYNPQTKVTEDIFTIPFRETRIDWGKTATSTHYIYPKTSTMLDGYLYRAKSGEVDRLPVSGFGLSSIGNEEIVLYSLQSEGFKTKEYNISSGLVEDSIINLLPEKCAKHNTTLNFSCGVASDKTYDRQSPNSWYRGDETYSDGIWEINPEAGYADYQAEIETRKGREVDIINPMISYDDAIFYFQNKLDGTAWFFALPPLVSNDDNQSEI